MSGINTDIYPLPDIIQNTLDNVDATNSNLEETTRLLVDTQSVLNVIDFVERPQALSIYNTLALLVGDNGTFALNYAGESETLYDVSVPAVPTPTTVATITLPQVGTYLISYMFSVNTNTPVGDPTPLTSAFVTWLLGGNTLANSNYSMTFYPSNAINKKNNIEIAISGTFPIYTTAINQVLAMRVNNAPEDPALNTNANNVSLTSCFISPYSSV